MATEHSFDISAAVDIMEVKNALETAKKEITARYDFKGLAAEVELNEKEKITKAIKDAKLKVTAAIRGEEVRVSGKSIDDLQECIRLVKGLNLELPISFKNLK